MKRLALVLLAFALLAGTAEAKKKRTYCQKAVHGEKAKVVAKKHGVTVYRRGRVISACSDAKKKALGLNILDAGTKVTGVAAANKRCVAIRSGGPGKLDQILFKDLAGKQIGSSIQIIGFNNPSGVVGSLSVANNCVAAWGEAVTDSAGTTTFRVRAMAFGAASDLAPGVNEVATVAAPDDVKHVGVKAHGRKVTVTWTQGGAPQSATLPAG
jgi:hypothetical protein